nr:MAG TPA: hypothetical protein [Caudoviricetes sp.]
MNSVSFLSGGTDRGTNEDTNSLCIVTYKDILVNRF